MFDSIDGKRNKFGFSDVLMGYSYKKFSRNGLWIDYC
jgi:hypothetical protein